MMTRYFRLPPPLPRYITYTYRPQCCNLYNDTIINCRTCWSGKWNNGVSTIGYRNGRHIVSLWSDCFSKFGVIRGLFNIIGLSATPSTLINKGKHKERAKLYGKGLYILRFPHYILNKILHVLLMFIRFICTAY